MELVRGPDFAQVLRERGDPGLPLGDVLEVAAGPRMRSSTSTSSRWCIGT